MWHDNEVLMTDLVITMTYSDNFLYSCHVCVSWVRSWEFRTNVCMHALTRSPAVAASGYILKNCCILKVALTLQVAGVWFAVLLAGKASHQQMTMRCTRALRRVRVIVFFGYICLLASRLSCTCAFRSSVSCAFMIAPHPCYPRVSAAHQHKVTHSHILHVVRY